MLILRSRWVLPISDGPLLNGWCALERGRVAAVGRAGSGLPFRDDAPLVDLGSMAVLPALVNAHAHLELSWLRGRVPPADALTAWVRTMMAVRFGAPADEPAVFAAITEAIAEMRASGTGAVGDVSNTLVSVPPIRDSHLRGVVFHELLRLTAGDADRVLEEGLARVARSGDGAVPVSLAAHAPYSVSPALFQGIRAALARRPFLPTTVHLAESAEEVELLAHGAGPWRTLLEELQAWDPAWVAPCCGPVEYLDRMKVLGPRLLVVHGVQLTSPELARLAERGCTLVTCPRSNAYVGAGAPPVARFYESGVPVAIGTDSLASNRDLNLFAELAELRRLAPSVPAAALLASATRTGARGLGLEQELGVIEPGRTAALIAVEVPEGVVDVEEYLVSSVQPGQVHWVRDLVGERWH